MSVPLAATRATEDCEQLPTLRPFADPGEGKLIVVIDDDALVLDGMRGMLQSWGCRVVTAASDSAAARRSLPSTSNDPI